ncbi:hypothetical protein GE09DRAFT_1148738 [Coniochaeta sp. 2T2.1]|nr:hypothetical protein GE09DRAFT_1148738 [Coniochaeta sp. 2T2.1]
MQVKTRRIGRRGHCCDYWLRCGRGRDGREGALPSARGSVVVVAVVGALFRVIALLIDIAIVGPKSFGTHSNNQSQSLAIAGNSSLELFLQDSPSIHGGLVRLFDVVLIHPSQDGVLSLVDEIRSSNVGIANSPEPPTSDSGYPRGMERLGEDTAVRNSGPGRGSCVVGSVDDRGRLGCDLGGSVVPVRRVFHAHGDVETLDVPLGHAGLQLVSRCPLKSAAHSNHVLTEEGVGGQRTELSLVGC